MLPFLCPSARRQDYALGYERINLLTNKCAIKHCECKLKLGSSRVLLPKCLITHSGHRTPINLGPSQRPAGWADLPAGKVQSVKFMAKLESVKKTGQIYRGCSGEHGD